MNTMLIIPGTPSIELPFATMYYEKQVVHIVLKKGSELGFPEIRSLTEHAEKLSGNRPYLVLSDSRAGVSVTPEGRKMAGDAKASPLNRGTAVLVKNSLISFAANFFTSKPGYPFHAFTDREKALEWLEKLKKNL